MNGSKSLHKTAFTDYEIFIIEMVTLKDKENT